MNHEKRPLNNLELRLMSELLKNSRRSDREVANVIGVSQPTVSRTLTKLRKEGFIRNFTIIPDFVKMGYSLLGITFVKLKTAYSAEATENVRKATKDRLEQSQFGIIMLERGVGLGYDAVIISIYTDYTEYTRHQEAIRTFPFIDTYKTETFIINLEDSVRYRPLSFETVAKQLANRSSSAKKS